MPTLSSLVAPNGVVMVTCDDKVGIMTTLDFQWLISVVCSSVIWNYPSIVYLCKIIYIFKSCCRRLIEMTSTKYECDSTDIKLIFAKEKYFQRMNKRSTPVPDLQMSSSHCRLGFHPSNTNLTDKLIFPLTTNTKLIDKLLVYVTDDQRNCIQKMLVLVRWFSVNDVIPLITHVSKESFHWSIATSQELCQRFAICCVLLWYRSGWFDPYPPGLFHMVLGQSYECPSAWSLKNMDKCIT